MNLIDIITRPDLQLLEVSEGIVPVIVRTGGLEFRALRIPAGGRIRIGDVLKIDELRSMPHDVGWSTTWATNLHRNGFPELRIEIVSSGSQHVTLAKQKLTNDALQESWQPLYLDWPTELSNHDTADMVIECRGGNPDAHCVLGISEAIDIHGPLSAYAKGEGIEIGPGHQPRIFPGPGVSVRYIEQATFEEWFKRYRKQPQHDTSASELIKMWQNYVVEDAQRLNQIPDESLHFIFSSHVFEHFVNPLGTLEVWYSKLRPGGCIIGIVPDANNCFDLRQPLSTTQDWWNEYSNGVWEYQTSHYEKWCQFTEPRITPESLQARNYSIHAHFYTPYTFSILLREVTETFRFQSYQIRAVRNHKDFGWLLCT